MFSTTMKYSTLLAVVLFAAASSFVGCGEDESSGNQEPGEGEAYLAVSIDGEASSLNVVEGRSVSVVADVENTGEVSTTGGVELLIDGDVTDVSDDVELDAGASTTVTMQWETEVGDVGEYTAEVASADDSDSVSVTIYEEDLDASLNGVVTDSDGSVMEGAQVVLFDSDSSVGSVTVDSEGEYEFTELEPGSYALEVEAIGLNPDYQIQESDGEPDRLDVDLEPDANTQDLTIDWDSQMELMIDGGELDFEYGDPNGELVMNLPGCEEQADGSWVPVGGETGGAGYDVNYDPDDECFQINGIDVDLASGDLAIDIDEILFPDVEIVIEDHPGFPDDVDIDRVEVDFEWLFDGGAGEVNYTDGSLDLDLGVRILVGGTVVLNFEGSEVPIDFGARDGENDCQLTANWGGDISNPESDDSDVQIGDYLHDPLRLRATTGESGPDQISGELYDPEERLFVTVDNAIEIDRLSEGSAGADDPGGASCGDIQVGDIEEDFAEVLNDLVSLPAASGSVFGEFNFVVP